MDHDYSQHGMERQLLALALLDKEDAKAVAGRMERDDFGAPAHRDVFEALKGLLHSEGGWSTARLMTVLPASEAVTLGRILAEVGSRHHLDALCEAIRHQRQLRDLRACALGLASEAAGVADPETVARRGAAQFQAIAQRRSAAEPVHIASVIAQALGPRPAMPTGFSDLDRLTKIQAGHLVTLGARTGVGKTALLTCMAGEAARQGWQILLFSFEMMLAELQGRLRQASFSLELPIWIQERLRGLDTHASVCSMAAGFIERHPDRPTAVMIDYLTLLRPTGRYLNRREQVGEVVRELKRMAMALEVPVIVAAQLSRPADEAKRSPQLSDLKETSEIEEASDLVLLLHRPNPETTEARLRIAKNRHGEAHRTIHLRFFAESARFTPSVPNYDFEEASHGSR